MKLYIVSGKIDFRGVHNALELPPFSLHTSVTDLFPFFSQLKYHAEFEKNKGKVTSVTDDPETLRLLQNQQKISGVGPSYLQKVCWLLFNFIA